MRRCVRIDLDYNRRNNIKNFCNGSKNIENRNT